MFTQNISINNRGLNFGDGFFTTILVQNNKVCDWSFHCDRIQTASKTLFFPTIKLPDLKSAIDSKLNERKSDSKRVVKIIFTRGNSNQGYSFDKAIEPVIFFNEYPWPEKYIKWQRYGVALQVSRFKLGINPSTSGIKHLNRIEQVLIKKEIDDNHWDDALVLDLNNKVIETSSANIFWFKKNKIYTPSIKNSGVNGIMRKKIINYFSKNKINVFEGYYELNDIFTAEEIFISNSLFGIVSVKKIANQYFHTSQFFKNLRKNILC
ncbi:aminodeoxychorismate lyase [Paraphotobacterium marinum]|uniref:Aminodeoxychorismate lyase n=1 Tax=Paraphotobacterium marinum TaxID=1755811 RepID=A0A220VCG7_9GAMM|nr:aminodeoxychorismate lyase [Paraphotobacterium marinum]ASK77663.1 aminodeoxychorismate lyase [Paraphotobacterium marinum]